MPALIREMMALQRELFDMGMTATSAEMSRAVERVGWEYAGKRGGDDLVTSSEHRRRQFLKDHGPTRLTP